MSKTGRMTFRKRRKSSATFHVDEDFSAGWRKRSQQPKLGVARTLGTAVSLCLGLTAIYVSLHYVPAYASPSQVIRVSDLDEKALEDSPKGAMAYIAPLWQSLQSRRSYVWSGESIEAQFRGAQGGLDLVVERCARQIVLEIFDCKVESREVLRVSGKAGKKRLRLSEPGFYRFSEQNRGDARVIWRRL